jgi:hypothetical protein
MERVLFDLKYKIIYFDAFNTFPQASFSHIQSFSPLFLWKLYTDSTAFGASTGLNLEVAIHGFGLQDLFDILLQ